MNMQTNQQGTCLKAVSLVGDIIALPGSPIPKAIQPKFLEFFQRLADRVVEIHMFVLKHVKSCLLSNPLRAETPLIIYKSIKHIYTFISY